MQDEETCKTFLEMTLAGQIGKITHLSSQNAILTGSEAKSIRLDILVKDENGKAYDIEMAFETTAIHGGRRRLFAPGDSVQKIMQAACYGRASSAEPAVYTPVTHNRFIEFILFF